MTSQEIVDILKGQGFNPGSRICKVKNKQKQNVREYCCNTHPLKRVIEVVTSPDDSSILSTGYAEGMYGYYMTKFDTNGICEIIDVDYRHGLTGNTHTETVISGVTKKELHDAELDNKIRGIKKAQKEIGSFGSDCHIVYIKKSYIDYLKSIKTSKTTSEFQKKTW